MTNEEFIQSIALEGEEWRDVPTWEGYYMISSFGRMLSVERTITSTDGRKYHFPFCLMKPNNGKHNGIVYNYARLSASKRKESIAVHRLVAKVFLPNPNNYPEVDHIDRNGLNNKVSNLRWCNRTMNMRNDNTRAVISKTNTNLLRKLTQEASIAVVQLKDSNVVRIYSSLSDTAQDGHSPGAICSVCKGKLLHHHGFRWMYLSDYESLINKSKNTLPAPITADYPQ